jgi:hypothetical protein
MKKLSRAQQFELIGRMIQTKQGRQKLAMSLTQPLRTERDYFSIGRKVLLAEDLPDGAYPIYEKDVDVRAFFISDTGEEVASVLTPANVQVPLFVIAALPEIPFEEIQDRRYDLVLRAKDRARSFINKKEDLRIFSLIEAAAEDTTNPNYPDAISASPSLAVEDLADAFGVVERHDLLVETILMNPRDYTDIRKFTQQNIDRETQRELRKTGLLATWDGARIMVSTQVTAGKVFVLAEKETVGRIPVKADLTVLSADDPKNRTIGFSCFERLGCLVHNPKAISEILISRNVEA